MLVKNLLVTEQYSSTFACNPHPVYDTKLPVTDASSIYKTQIKLYLDSTAGSTLARDMIYEVFENICLRFSS